MVCDEQSEPNSLYPFITIKDRNHDHDRRDHLFLHDDHDDEPRIIQPNAPSLSLLEFVR